MLLSIVIHIPVGSILAKFIYEPFFSPLHAIPGPALARLSQYYVILIDTASNRTSHIHKLHGKYGPAVRIGPNEVSFSCPSVVRELYSFNTTFRKAPWYSYFSTPPIGVFSLQDRQKHAERRRLLSPAFSQPALDDIEPTLHQLVIKLVERTRRIIKTNNVVDLLDSCRRLSLDIVGALFLGQSFQAVEFEKTPEFCSWMDNLFIGFGIKYAFPLVDGLLGVLPFKAIQEFRSAGDNLAEKSQKRDLLTRFLASNDAEKGDAFLDDAHMHREVSNLVFVGSDTTSATLTYLFWEVAKHTDWQQRLQQELQGKFPIYSQNSMPKHRELVDLPILDAVVNETLRLHPAAPASLQRETPAGGKVLAEHFIPEKTVVSMQCYTTQRDAIAFHNPDDWQPGRWLDGSAENERAKELFMPFSKGSRNCLGKGLAMMELKFIAAIMLMEFSFEVPPNTTEKSMAMVDHFLMVPAGGRCGLKVSNL